MERPKVLPNTADNTFALWFHLDTPSFSLQMVGVAISKSIFPCAKNAYLFQAGFQPDDLPSYDMGLYQDIDQTNQSGSPGYLVRSVSNQYAGISELKCVHPTFRAMLLFTMK